MNIPNAISLYSSINALIAVFLMAQGHIKAGLCIYYLSFLCDAWDGTLARKLKQETPEGVQFDSLSDFFSFGVFPIVSSFYLYGFSVALLVSGCIYVACAAIRLAYYNVHGLEEGQYFTGVASTFVASGFYIINVLFHLVAFKYAVVIVCVYAIAAGLLMVASLKVKKRGIFAKCLFFAVPLAAVVCLIL
jgi:CDP-diacylglycerol--serine O-phosphatidyltransferase